MIKLVTLMQQFFRLFLTACGLNKEIVALEILNRKCALILSYALDAISINNKVRDVIFKA